MIRSDTLIARLVPKNRKAVSLARKRPKSVATFITDCLAVRSGNQEISWVVSSFFSLVFTEEVGFFTNFLIVLRFGELACFVLAAVGAADASSLKNDQQPIPRA